LVETTTHFPRRDVEKKTKKQLLIPVKNLVATAKGAMARSVPMALRAVSTL